MKRYLTVVGLIALTAISAGAVRAEERWDLDAERSEISFAGKSTLHEFQGNAPQMNGYLLTDRQGEASVTKGRVVVAVDKLDTQNVKRDRTMKKMLASADNPEIALDITSIDVPASEGEDMVCRLKGELAIAGKTKKMESEGHCLRKEDHLSVIGAFDVSLAQYDLHPPSVLGVIRVSDRVRVDYDVTFHKPSAKEQL